MTNQEMFDKIVAHARKQGCKAIDLVQACMYRGTNNTKCFIGALIPDDKYSPSMEGKSVNEFEVHVAAGITDEQLPLANALQIVHDCADVSAWETRFEQTAQSHELTYTAPATETSDK